MRTGTLFMNTARGGLVDESALFDALDSGQLRAAYLDVFETEPLPEHNPLWSLQNVLISPHSADMISDWELKTAEFLVGNYQCGKSGKDLVNLIHMPSA
jgi:phosphoglycerate dehydrogenase-like enzyme